MVRHRRWSLLAMVLAGAACSTAPSELRRDRDPAIAASERSKLDQDEQRRDFQRVLVQLDQALDSWVRATNNSGVQRYDVEKQRLDRLLRQLVSGQPPGSNTDRLIALASDGTDRHYQGIALAALGFADRSDVMPLILQGAQLDDALLVDRAVLGLAILHDPRTPPGVVAAVMNDPKRAEHSRINAAWALVVLQENSQHLDQIVAEWTRMLQHGVEEHPLLLANAVRGLGMTRDRQHAELVARLLAHPTPRVRINAAVALGRMNAQDQHEKLLGLLAPSETVPNVRLAARKALQALAGRADHGYDVALWRREFQRGQ